MRGHLYRDKLPNLPSDSERLWRAVDKTTDCWLWTGTLGSNGYGSIGVIYDGHNIVIGAHVLSYLIANGEIPEGLCVCHSCDVLYPLHDKTSRRCVRPDHLWLGTYTENGLDAYRKGRMPQCISSERMREAWSKNYDTWVASRVRGEDKYNAKLCPAIVKEIRSKYIPRSYSTRRLAEEYGVSQTLIRLIIERKAWKHVL